MNKVLDKLPALIEEELQAAMDEHGDFHSFHEGYAVLLEEVEELKEACEGIEFLLSMVWENVRNDHEPEILAFAHKLDRSAQHCAAEAIQVAAMACKLIRFGEKE